MIRIPVWVAVFLIVAIPTLIWAGEFIVPHVFVPGTPIKSAEVNANFAALQAEASASDRFFVTGASVPSPYAAGTPGIYDTPLDHPLLNNNPDAMIFVSAPQLVSCTNRSSMALKTYYEGGRWSIFNTCQGARYNVLVFNGPRVTPPPSPQP